MDFVKLAQRKVSLCVVLQNTKRYPGDHLSGVVEVSVLQPTTFTSIEAVVLGEEVTQQRTFLARRLDSDARLSTYYRQRILLAGENFLSHWYNSLFGSTTNSNNHHKINSPEKEDIFSREGSPVPVMTSGLMPGIYTFPFSVKLPDTLPPTYEERRFLGISKMSYRVKVFFCNRSEILEKTHIYFTLRMLPVNMMQWMRKHLPLYISHTSCNALCDVKNKTKAEQELLDNGTEFNMSTEIHLDHSLPLWEEEGMTTNKINKQNNGEEMVNDEESDKGAIKNKESKTRNKLKPHVNRWMLCDDAQQSMENDRSTTLSLYGGQQYSSNEPERARERNVADTHDTSGSVHPNLVNPSSKVELDLCVCISGFFKKGKVNVRMTLDSLIFEVGKPVSFHAVIHNCSGSFTVTRIVFQLVNYVELRSLARCEEYRYIVQEIVLHERLSKDEVFGVPETEFLIPSNAFVTLVTAGYGSRTYVEVRVSFGSALRTFSSSARAEIVVVYNFDTQSHSERVRRWTNFYRGRELGNGTTSAPDIICPFVHHGVMQVEEEEDVGKEHCESTLLMLGSGHSLPKSCQRRTLDLEHVLFHPYNTIPKVVAWTNPLQPKNQS